MSCNADIETETVENVISVPIQSVTARTDIPVDEDSTKADDRGRKWKWNDEKQKAKGSCLFGR